jgi:hypothetical protein
MENKYRVVTPEMAPWGGYRTCLVNVPYPVLFGDASVRVNWRVNSARPMYGSIYDGSLDPDRVGVGYVMYAPFGVN